MTTIGSVTGVWRYPVKSMAGEELDSAFLGYPGVFGDRLFAFVDEAGPEAFPWVTGRAIPQMLLYRPRFRGGERSLQPPNREAAAGAGPGLTPLPGEPADLEIDVETPSGAVLALDDVRLRTELGGGRRVRLVRSDRALTDCRPISLFALETARGIERAIAGSLDLRRFRANLYLDLSVDEASLVGRSLKLGPAAVVAVLGRDPRCRMITLDPDTAEADPRVLEAVVRDSGNMAGLYGAVLSEGMVSRGDEIVLLD